MIRYKLDGKDITGQGFNTADGKSCGAEFLNLASEQEIRDMGIEITVTQDVVPDQTGELLRRLYDIDMKSIRPLRTGEKDKLAALEAEAFVIRDQLKQLGKK